MEWEKVAEKLRDMILGEIKEEFRDVKASVTGELSGFRLAIESLNSRQANMEKELRDIRRAIEDTNKRIDDMNKRLDDTNKRIDDTNKRMDRMNSDLIARMDQTNSNLVARMDKTHSDLVARMDNMNNDLVARMDKLTSRMDNQNGRIDHVFMDLSEIKGDLKKALSEKETINDIVARVGRLDAKVA